MAAGSEGLGELGPATLHVVVDMQRMFAEQTEWHVPAMADVMPGIEALTAAHRSATVFTRFVTPSHPREATGRWQIYYRRWRSMAADRLDAAMIELIDPLRAIATHATMFDKTTYSAFGSAPFVACLSERNIRSLVLSGVETDVCVLATALEAVDRGLHVIVAADAVTSWSPASHRATIELVLPRLDQQIRIATVEEILAAWPLD